MKRHRLPPLSACLLAPVLAAAVFAAGCGPVRLIASANIPAPLVTKIPIGVALFIPKDFAAFVHKEERWNTEWNVDLGKAQAEGLTRLFNAMFDRVVTVDSLNAGSQVGNDIRAILEPSVEEYAFVTPRDAGSPFYAVSIKYRVNVYSPDGRLADSWGFTGYGTSPSQGLSSSEPLAQATSLALRDAGAKLAVEFREQAIIRGLLPESESADGPPIAPTAPAELPGTTPAQAATPASEVAPASTEPSQTETSSDAPAAEESPPDGADAASIEPPTP